MGVVSNGYVQCQQCGSEQQVKVDIDIESDPYVILKCPRCRGKTSHLWIGVSLDDKYLYYNINIDPRYYKYTQQND